MKAILCLALTGCLLGYAAQAATLVVVEARGVNLKPGATLDSDRPLVLKQGQHVTLISETGSTLKLDGPYDRPPTAGGNAGVGLANTLAVLVTQRQSRSGEFGTTRGTALASLPDPWVVDVSHSGAGCVAENGNPAFWRPDSKTDATLAVAPVDRSWKAQSRWPAGQDRILITTDVPMQSGQTYIVNFNGSEYAIALTLVPAALSNDQMRAAWMADKGCEAQAEALGEDREMKAAAHTTPLRTLLRNIAFIAAALVCAALALLATTDLSLLNRINQFVQDWEIASVFAPAEAQDPQIVIVAIDEPTLTQFAYRSPVDRQFVSDLLQRLAAHAPTAIGLDLLLDQPTEAAKDVALRQTISGLKVPLVVSYVAASDTISPEQKAFEDAIVPERDRGLADLPTDQFDTARGVYPGARMTDGRYLPGFARALAARAGVVTPAVQVPIIWHGRPPATATDSDPRPFRQVSAAVAGFMPDSWFRGKIVLIGSDVTLVDRHRTPFSTILAGDAGQLPGIVIQAHSLSQLLQHKTQPQVGWEVDFAVTLLLALLGAGLGMAGLPLLLRVAGGLLLILLFWTGGVALFHGLGVMIGLLAPVLALIATFSTVDSLGGREARKQRAFIQGAFSRYVSPKVVERMVEDPSRMGLEGERRVMTFLFSDIKDFTTMSEKLELRELAKLLNAYLDGMTEIVMKHDGMVDKFIGDAVFAIFNAPIDLPDHAQKAVRCMLAMDDFAERFRREQQSSGIPLGLTRIGVHTGAAVIGNFGSQARFTYTAQGDAVNTAARIEGINKYFGTRLCVSGATRELCDGIAFRPVASVVLKGKSEALMLYEPLRDGAFSPDYLSAYQAAHERLAQNQPDAAALFAALAAARPDDPCVKLHVERLQQGETGIEMVMTEK